MAGLAAVTEPDIAGTFVRDGVGGDAGDAARAHADDAVAGLDAVRDAEVDGVARPRGEADGGERAAGVAALDAVAVGSRHGGPANDHAPVARAHHDGVGRRWRLRVQALGEGTSDEGSDAEGALPSTV